MEIKLFEHYDAAELEKIDYRLLGLVKGKWDFERGAKTEKFFTDPTTGKIKVRVSYIYVYLDENRKIIPTHKVVEWYKEDGTVGHSVNVLVNYSIKKEESVLRDIRQGQIDYLNKAAQNLEDQADAMPVTPTIEVVQALIAGQLLPPSVIDVATYEAFRLGLYQIVAALESMFNHWGSGIDNYVSRQAREFENEVINEDNASYLFVLSQISRIPDIKFPVGLTVFQSIMYQLKGTIPT